MNFFKDIVNRMNTFTVFDYAFYEISIFAFTLLLAKYFPFLTSGYTWIYLVVVAIGLTHMYDVMYPKKGLTSTDQPKKKVVKTASKAKKSAKSKAKTPKSKKIA